MFSNLAKWMTRSWKGFMQIMYLLILRRAWWGLLKPLVASRDFLETFYLSWQHLAGIQNWLIAIFVFPYWWLIEYWMTAILVHAYLYYILIRFPLVTLKATNSNYWAGKRLPLITFYYLNSFLCPSITFITLNGKSLPIKEMAPYNRHDPKKV